MPMKNYKASNSLKFFGKTLSIIALLSFLHIQCNNDDTTPGPDSNPGQLAEGQYFGQFSCVSFNGSSYPTDQYAGSLTLAESGPDTLIVQNSDGCVFAEQHIKFKYEGLLTYFDADAMTDRQYHKWVGFSNQYQDIYYVIHNDSISISTPWHSSQGWLGREFHGKK
jgi:hypothetical protein